MKEKKKDLELGIMNGDVAIDYYKNNPCLVGYHYTRLEPSGDVRGCCIMKHPAGTTEKKTWSEVWHGQGYESFREKMKTIQDTHFHINDPEWGFCQQCSHRNMNEKMVEILNTPFEK